MKLWVGVGAVVLTQGTVVALDKGGLDVSFGGSKAIAQSGERGEGGERGEKGKQGERGNRNQGERGERGNRRQGGEQGERGNRNPGEQGERGNSGERGARGRGERFNPPYVSRQYRPYWHLPPGLTPGQFDALVRGIDPRDVWPPIPPLVLNAIFSGAYDNAIRAARGDRITPHDRPLFQ